MAPKKKKAVKATQAKGRKGKSLLKSKETEEIPTDEPIEEKIQSIPPSQTKVQATKKFGKFRCLLENTSLEMYTNTSDLTQSCDENSLCSGTSESNLEPIQTTSMSQDIVETSQEAELSSEASNLDKPMEMSEESTPCETTNISERLHELAVSEDIFPHENDIIIECMAEETLQEEQIVDTSGIIKETSTVELICLQEEGVILDSPLEQETLIIEEVTHVIEEKTEEIEMHLVEEPIVTPEDSQEEKLQDDLTVEEQPEPEVEKPKQEEEEEQKETTDDVIVKEEPEQSESPKVKETKPKAKRTPKPKITKPRQTKSPKGSRKTKTVNTEGEASIRRSTRIKTISVLKQRSKGYGLVKPKVDTVERKRSKPCQDSDTSENSNSGHAETDKTSGDSCNFLAPSSHYDMDQKPVKVKSRWRRSSELEMSSTANKSISNGSNSTSPIELDKEAKENILRSRLKQFVHLKENQYLTDRLCCKEAKKMVCDCFLTHEEIERGEYACGDDCLNRLLMIECGPFCPVNDRCTNKKFQKAQFSPCEAFHTDKKGIGIRATANIPFGEFILEYIGEVIGPDDFENRAAEYSKGNNPHYYFMSLRSDAVIDATQKGNISRFINHSCDPNAETQKWTVNGELRIGFFSKRTILAGEEITFDYQFQRYGKEAQKCFCETATCRGWIGEEPGDEDEDDEEEEDDDEETPKSKKSTTDKKDEETKEITNKETGKQAKAKPVKKDRPKRRTVRKEIFEDIDVNEEIDMLSTTGLKNQSHTLKLSRLMVRATEVSQRSRLLRILRHGEFPCRRLFLDYHGLRLIHGWMNDAQQKCKTDEKQESLRLEMLQTLAILPIPNKTILQDSKVLPTVESWSTKLVMECESESNSPVVDMDKEKEEKPVKIESEETTPIQPIPQKVEITDQVKPEDENEDIRKSVGMENRFDIDNVGCASVDDIMNMFDEEMDDCQLPYIETVVEVKQEEKRNYEEEINDLAQKLLEEWSNLKEVFRIPKKERIEQMKEHEREADRGYKPGLEHDLDKRKYRFQRYRDKDVKDAYDRLRRVTTRFEEKPAIPKVDKFERRKLFEIQQVEEDRRRRQREAWRQHEQYCLRMGMDPRLTAPFDPSSNYHCVWNPQIGQWQNMAMPFQRFPMPYPNTPMMPNMMSQIPGMPANLSQVSIPPNVHTALQTIHSMPMNGVHNKTEEVEEVKFAGPIPPPVKLPPKWKCGKDKYGRPYYYHIKTRISQWEPPVSQPDDNDSNSTSSSDTSSLSSSSSEEDSEEDELDDTKLLMEIKKKFKLLDSGSNVQNSPDELSKEEEEKNAENQENLAIPKSLDERLKEVFNVIKNDVIEPQQKKKKPALVTEVHIISPRSEEDKLFAKENIRKYKETKEKLRKQKEVQKEAAIQEQIKKRVKVTIKNQKKHKAKDKTKTKECIDMNSEEAKKIKETFRVSMASIMVGILNPYRKNDCKEGRITTTEDFKHLARKLTHFVMVKELKHCKSIEDLICTESVKVKAKEFVRKYMSKFGEMYQKPPDDLEY